MDFHLYALADGELQVLLCEWERARFRRHVVKRIDHRLAFLFECWAASAESA